MTRTISQRELRNDSAEIMRELAAGNSFVITRSGVVVGRLEPATATAGCSITALRARSRSRVRIDLDRLREDLDAVVDQDM